MTTRLHANWNGGVDDVDDCSRGWRQLARPQVHGHAVACVAALPPCTEEVDGSNPGECECGSTVFVSGSDEKMLRVFEAPGPFLGTLAKSLGGEGKSGAVAASAAASSGRISSTLFSPSLSKMTTLDFASLSDSTSTALASATPIAVASNSLPRGTVSSTRRNAPNASSSSVGGQRSSANRANATTPTRSRVRAAANSSARSRAASMRR